MPIPARVTVLMTVGAIASVALASGAIALGSLHLYPVRLTLAPERPVETMTIINDGSELSRIQLRVYAWRQVGESDLFDDTRDILANPGLFEVAPGSTQIARFGLRTPKGGVEKAYRVILEQVPSGQPSKPGEVRTMLRISIPIFVPPTQPLVRLTWRAMPSADGRLALGIRNEGTVHVQLNRLALDRSDGQALIAEDMSVYVLPGNTRTVTLSPGAPVRAGETLTLEATTDQGDLIVALPVEATANDAGSD